MGNPPWVAGDGAWRLTPHQRRHAAARPQAIASPAALLGTPECRRQCYESCNGRALSCPQAHNGLLVQQRQRSRQVLHHQAWLVVCRRGQHLHRRAPHVPGGRQQGAGGSGLAWSKGFEVVAMELACTAKARPTPACTPARQPSNLLQQSATPPPPTIIFPQTPVPHLSSSPMRARNSGRAAGSSWSTGCCASTSVWRTALTTVVRASPATWKGGEGAK